MMYDEWTMIGRIALAALLGLLVGLERERHGRAAGLRTCVLVSMAGALVMSLSVHMGHFFEPFGESSIFRVDPSRLPSYAIAGVGFLGAGAIIQGRGSAIGVTTAAALWTCTGLGLAVGAGLYLPALAVTALALLSLTFLKVITRRLRREQYINLTVTMDQMETHHKIKELFKQFHAHLRFDSRTRDLVLNRTEITYSVRIRSGSQWSDFLSQLEALPGITSYCWEESTVN